MINDVIHVPASVKALCQIHLRITCRKRQHSNIWLLFFILLIPCADHEANHFRLTNLEVQVNRIMRRLGINPDDDLGGSPGDDPDSG